MSWSDRLVAALDARSIVVETAHGAVQMAREGQGPSVLVVHGGPGGFDQGLAWCRHLRDGGCEVIAPSRPGYLRTPLQSGASPEDQADLYAAMLDAVGVERVAVMGFSSGGASAVHFAARHPERTTALLLDTAIVLPFEPPIGALRRSTFEAGFFVWMSYQLVMRRPELMARFMIDGVSAGLTKEQKREAVGWITSDAARLSSMQEQFASVAPPGLRRPGWRNDLDNERSLAPLPFADVAAPTLVAWGANDVIVPLEHATTAAASIAGAELMLVEQGHHLLSLSRCYGSVAQRQLELTGSQGADRDR